MYATELLSVRICP